MKGKKIVCMLLVCGLVLVQLLTGCGDTGSKKKGSQTEKDVDPNEKITITFAGWGTVQEKAIFTKLVAEFMDLYPNIKVNYQHYAGYKANYMTKLTSKLASNSMPDAFYIPTQNFSEWADSGMLLDLTDHLKASKTYQEGTIWEEAMKMFRYNGETKTVGQDGGLYGLPKDLGPYALVYNKTLFEQMGVPLPDPNQPMTMSEFVAMGKKLTSGSGADKIYAVADYPVETVVYSYGADFLSGDHKKITINTPEFAEAIQWLADLNLVHGISPSASETSTSSAFERWCSGKLAMYWMGPWDQATFWESVDFEWDIIPTPVNEKTGLGTTWLDSAALCVSSKSKYADAAYKLIEFFCMNEEAQTRNYQLGQAVPNLIKMAETDYLAMEAKPANKQVFLDIIIDEKKGKHKPTYYTPDTEWYDYFSSYAGKVYKGEMKAKEFCSSMQDQLQKLLDDSYRD